MEETKPHLITRISDYLRARVWLRDYTITRNSSGATQTGLLDTNGQAGQEIFCSLVNGSIAPMDKLAL
jgi:hypothetical protein